MWLEILLASGFVITASGYAYHHLRERLDFRSIDLNKLFDIAKKYVVHAARDNFSNAFDSGNMHLVGENLYDLHYYSGTTRHTIRFPANRGPRSFSRVYDSDQNDVTSKILEFAGVSHNFHSVPTTPRMLGYSSLIVAYRNGQERRFEEDEVISV